MNEVAIERALLGELAAHGECHPAALVAACRRSDAALPRRQVHRVLARLVRERRVARLWHRYLLGENVDRTRRRWLDRLQARRGSLETSGCGYSEVRQALLRWDGWTFGPAKGP